MAIRSHRTVAPALPQAVRAPESQWWWDAATSADDGAAPTPHVERQPPHGVSSRRARRHGVLAAAVAVVVLVTVFVVALASRTAQDEVARAGAAQAGTALGYVEMALGNYYEVHGEYPATLEQAAPYGRVELDGVTVHLEWSDKNDFCLSARAESGMAMAQFRTASAGPGANDCR